MSKIAKESIDRFFDYDIHVESRTIYVGSVQHDIENGDSGIDGALAERTIKAIALLSTTPDKPIKIILNSTGGDWYSGMAIYGAIRNCPCYVTIEVMGSAMSMASIIFQGADERIIHPDAVVMVHDGTESMQGHAKNFETWAEQSKAVRERMYEIYAERSGKSKNYWEKKCTIDYVMTAEKAVEEGLADSVVEYPPLAKVEK